MIRSKDTNKNIIIGAATGYQKKDLFYFVETARKVFSGRIVLIVNNKINSETNHYLNRKKIDLFLQNQHQERYIKIDIRYILILLKTIKI